MIQQSPPLLVVSIKQSKVLSCVCCSDLTKQQPSGRLLTASLCAGPVTVNGNTVLSSAGAGHTMTVYAAADFSAGLTATAATVTGALAVQGNSAIGLTSAQTLTVNAASTFAASVTANSNMTITGTLTARGNVALGLLGGGRSLTVSAATTVFSPSEAGASVTVAGTSTFAAINSAVIGTNRSNSLTVNSESTFNGAVTSLVGVQVRAVNVTPAPAGTDSPIPNTVSFVDATGNKDSSNILRLPVPIMGLRVQILAGPTRFLLAPFGSTYLINDDATYKTHTVFPNQLVECVAVSAKTFYCSVTGPVWTCAGICSQVLSPLLGTFAAGQDFVD